MLGDATPHRSEGRYYIKTGMTRVTVTVFSDDGPPEKLVGQLLDVSPRGIRIEVNGRLEPGQPIELSIEVPSQSLSFERTAVVCWQQPRATKTWWTGCELTQPLQPEAIEQLAKAHVLNRRRDPRYPVDKPARVRTELSNATTEAKLVNYSKGGFCLLFDEKIQFEHERLLLIITLPDNEKEMAIPARVMWTRQVQGAFGVGCAFTGMDGFLQLRQYAGPHGQRRRYLVRATTPVISAWMALAMTITIGLQTSWLLQSRPQLAAVLRDRWSEWVVEPIRDRFPSDGEPDGANADMEQAR